MRAIQKTPDVLEALFDEVAEARGGSRSLDAHAARLKDDLANANDFEARARDLCDRLALALQGSLVVRHAPPAVADAYCASRIEGRGARQFGAFPRSVDGEAIVRRAAPRG
jgi:putative acyl-CoA dehydrogenase